MSINLYKPTAKMTGAALSLQASDRDKSLYLTVLKQATWDANRKKGSFIDNKNKPGFCVTVKLNQIEAAGMIDAIERFYTFSAYHSSAAPTTAQIYFGPADGENPSTYVLKIVQTNRQDTTKKYSFFIPINFAEARLVKEYLIHYLHKSFRIIPQTEKKQEIPIKRPAPTPQPEEPSEPENPQESQPQENTPEPAQHVVDETAANTDDEW